MIHICPAALRDRSPHQAFWAGWRGCQPHSFPALRRLYGLVCGPSCTPKLLYPSTPASPVCPLPLRVPVICFQRCLLLVSCSAALCRLLLGSCLPSGSRTPQAEELRNSGKVPLHLKAEFGGQMLVREGLGRVVDVGLPASAFGGRGHHSGVCLYGFCPHDIMTS